MSGSITYALSSGSITSSYAQHDVTPTYTYVSFSSSDRPPFVDALAEKRRHHRSQHAALCRSARHQPHRDTGLRLRHQQQPKLRGTR